MWAHREYRETHEEFSLDAALEARCCDETALPLAERVRFYAECIAEARAWAERLGEPPARPAGSPPEAAAGQFGELQFFNVG
jgi:hypothetical protein